MSLEQRIRVPVSGGVLGDTKEATTSALVCSVSKVCIVCTFHQPGSQLRVCCKPRANVWNSALRRTGVLGCCRPARAGYLLSLLAAPTIHHREPTTVVLESGAVAPYLVPNGSKSSMLTLSERRILRLLVARSLRTGMLMDRVFLMYSLVSRIRVRQRIRTVVVSSFVLSRCAH